MPMIVNLDVMLAKRKVRSKELAEAIGIGVTVHDGYRFTPDPFAPGISDAEARRRYDIYRRRTSWGSRVLFNPNAAIGVRLNRRWAAELAWEHFSHRRIFSDTNPGIDTLGIRLVRRLGR